MTEDLAMIPPDFRGTEKAAAILDRLMQFLNDEIRPMEEAHGLKWGDIAPHDMLKQVWKRSAEEGFYTLLLPESLGGAGLSMRDICALKESAIAHGPILTLHVLGELSGPPRIGHLYTVATEDQTRRYLDPVCRAEKAVSFALTEAEAGSDATAISTRAERQGDHFVLNGTKRYISGAPYSDFAVVMAVTDPDAGARGISAFFVDLDRPGCEVRSDYEVLSGQKSHADLHFTDVEVPADNLIGEEGRGFSLGMARITLNRLLHCATMMGYARLALNESIARATGREQFGQAIGGFQAIQHMLADMATDHYAAFSMMLDAADLHDKGQDIRAEASMCKLKSAETCFDIADKAVQVHGGAGLMKGGAPEYLFRFLRMYRIVTGTSEIQRNTIAKSLLRPGANA